MFLHGNKWLSKKDRKGWCCDKILVHLKEFGWELGHGWNKKWNLDKLILFFNNYQLA